MPISVNTNVGALAAMAASTQTNKALETAMTRLSTGKRINTAGDDAAGIAITARLTSEVKGLNVAIRNALDAQSLIDTTEGAQAEVTNILQRMRELSVKAANDTNSDSDRKNLDAEVQALVVEIDRISSTTTWAGVKILHGEAALDLEPKMLSFQVGFLDETSQKIEIGVKSSSAKNLGIDPSDQNVSLNMTAPAPSNPTNLTIAFNATTGALAFSPIDTTALNLDLSSYTVASSSSISLTAGAVGTNEINFNAVSGGFGDISFTIDGKKLTVSVQASDNSAAIASKAKTAIDSAGIGLAATTSSGGLLTLTRTPTAGTLSITLNKEIVALDVKAGSTEPEIMEALVDAITAAKVGGISITQPTNITKVLSGAVNSTTKTLTLASHTPGESLTFQVGSEMLKVTSGINAATTGTLIAAAINAEANRAGSTAVGYAATVNSTGVVSVSKALSAVVNGDPRLSTAVSVTPNNGTTNATTFTVSGTTAGKTLSLSVASTPLSIESKDTEAGTANAIVDAFNLAKVAGTAAQKLAYADINLTANGSVVTVRKNDVNSMLLAAYSSGGSNSVQPTFTIAGAAGSGPSISVSGLNSSFETGDVINIVLDNVTIPVTMTNSEVDATTAAEKIKDVINTWVGVHTDATALYTATRVGSSVNLVKSGAATGPLIGDLSLGSKTTTVSAVDGAVAGTRLLTIQNFTTNDANKILTVTVGGIEVDADIGSITTAGAMATALAQAINTKAVSGYAIAVADTTNGTVLLSLTSSVGYPDVKGDTFQITKHSFGAKTAQDALSSLTRIDAAIETINDQRSALGAVSNRLSYTVSNLTNIVTNLDMSRGRIEDADFAAESANMARFQILQQAGTAMLAQANASKKDVLSLIK
jgi:flagellin